LDRLARNESGGGNPRTAGETRRTKLPVDRTLQKKPDSEVVMASPYSPGVRMAGNRQMPAARKLDGHSSTDPTALVTAQAVARRAAERFRQMRDRMMTKALQADSVDELARQRFMRPVIARAPQGAPRVIPASPGTQRVLTPSVLQSGRMGIGINAKAEENSPRSGLVRPRLVRQPLSNNDTTSPVVASAGATSRHVAISRSAANLRLTDINQTEAAAGRILAPSRTTENKRPSLPQLLARATPADEVVMEVRRVRRAQASRSGRHKRSYDGRSKQRRTSAHRVARQTYRPSRRSKRKIDGFRPSFHRQLVRANFFSPQN
jgi:hypothetical protein